MKAARFIAGKLKFRGRIAMACIAVSFLVMIVAVAVSSGFRDAVRDGVSSIAGDVTIAPADMNYLTGTEPIELSPSYLPHVEALKCVESVSPVVYRAGIIRDGDIIHGVVFKGVVREHADSLQPLSVSVPARLLELTGAATGDDLLAYFVGESVKVRKFRIGAVHESILASDDNMTVYADIDDIRRVNGWTGEQISAFEVRLSDGLRNEAGIKEAESEIGSTVYSWIEDDEASVICTSSVSAYPQLFDWLDLIDFNVLFILGLMTLVAGFNMISGLLILLFERISTIGTLKALGMENRDVAEIFLRVSSSYVLKGMVIGNVLAVLFCMVQSATGFLTLDPENYFVSAVPLRLDFIKILAADAVAYIVIMLLLLLPSLFISRIDPAKTVRMN